MFYGGYYCDLGLLLGALHSVGFTGKVFSGDGSDSSALITSTNPRTAANGVYASCGCAVIGKSAADKQFAAGFKKVAGFAPAIYSAEAFDAANSIIDEMKILASAKTGTMAITRTAVVAGLHKIKYVGLTKTISFQPNGNISGNAIYVNRVLQGQLLQIGLE